MPRTDRRDGLSGEDWSPSGKLACVITEPVGKPLIEAITPRNMTSMLYKPQMCPMHLEVTNLLGSISERKLSDVKSRLTIITEV